MLKILAPFDGSNCATRMLDQLITLAQTSREAEVCLINIREPIDAMQVREYWSDDQIAEFQNKEGSLLLEPAAKRLTQAGIKHDTQVVVGDIAQSIAAQASAKGCTLIMMGTRGMGSIGNLLMGSVATKVIHLANVPVTLVK